MSKVTMKYFDVFNFVKKAKEFGVNEQFAEYEARQIEQAINTIANEVKMEIKKELHSDELVTKNDLKQQLEIVKLELQKEIEIVRKEIAQASNKALLLMGTFGIFFLGALAKGFHWVL
jgi:hypothetical protein